MTKMRDAKDMMEEREHTTQTVDGLVPALVAIPAGWFLMGCAAGRDPLSQDSERPVHRVWIDEFMLAAYQVTNADYARFVQATRRPGVAHSRATRISIILISQWWQSRGTKQTRYCEWLSASTGRTFRLPTEAEWERAARGGREGGLYPWGDTPPAVAARLCGALRSVLEDRPRAGRRWRAQRIRSLQHVRQRSRVVQRLVLARLLCDLARAQSARPGDRPAPFLSRRVMASSRQDVALRRPFEHSSGISILGLRFQDRVRLRRGVNL